MLGWIILAVIAALVCLLLSVKVGVRICFGEELKVWIKVGSIMAQVYPPKEKTAKKEKTPKEDKAAKKRAAKEPTPRKITFEAVRSLIEAMLPLALDAMGRVRRGLRIRVLELRLTISDQNPATAAQRFGKLQTFLWPLLAAVENLVTVERRDVRVDLDFAAKKSSASGEVFITMRVHHAVRMGLMDGLKAIKPLLRFLKTTKVSKPTEHTNDTNDTAAA